MATVYSIGLIVEKAVRSNFRTVKDVPMNIALALPESRQQSVGSVVLSGLMILVAAAADRGTTVKAVPRPYSFLSECECPDDCLRDHENE